MATPSVVVFLNIRQLEFHRITILTRVVIFCFSVFETEPFWSLCGGLFFLCFVAPSLAVFFGAYAFNQDVSKWNTGAVKSMQQSKCTLSLSLWPRLPLLCCLNVRQLEFHRITILTRLVVLFCVFETVPFLLFVVGLVFLFFVAPSLAVFNSASAFNQDVSKWNTGAVTRMDASKCTLSPSLWPCLPLCVYLNIRQLEFYLITILTHFVLFVFVFETETFCLWWVGLSFSLLHPLLQCLIPHLYSIRTCPNGIRGW